VFYQVYATMADEVTPPRDGFPDHAGNVWRTLIDEAEHALQAAEDAFELQSRTQDAVLSTPISEEKGTEVCAIATALAGAEVMHKHTIATKRALVHAKRTLSKLARARDAIPPLPCAPGARCWRCDKPEEPEGDGELLWNFHVGRYLLVAFRGLASHPPCARCNACNMFLRPSDPYTIFAKSLYCKHCVDTRDPGESLDDLHAIATQDRACEELARQQREQFVRDQLARRNRAVPHPKRRKLK
jgi:hypothetical protein